MGKKKMEEGSDNVAEKENYRKNGVINGMQLSAADLTALRKGK